MSSIFFHHNPLFIHLDSFPSMRSQGTLPTREAGTAWSWSAGGSRSAATDNGIGREAKEEEAVLCDFQPGQRALQSRPAVHTLMVVQLFSSWEIWYLELSSQPWWNKCLALNFHFSLYAAPLIIYASMHHWLYMCLCLFFDICIPTIVNKWENWIFIHFIHCPSIPSAYLIVQPKSVHLLNHILLHHLSYLISSQRLIIDSQTWVMTTSIACYKQSSPIRRCKRRLLGTLLALVPAPLLVHLVGHHRRGGGARGEQAVHEVGHTSSEGQHVHS